ncbi:MAG: twin-arginine translocase TatA/TatE family subunit [Alphaproteobacteria bacterium]|nr:twin-arginine translocase TatA/TatE family subunit [Alphaproteobacteria bacterium]
MGGFSLWHWLIVLLVVLILFGRGRVSEIMGDFGKGIKSFKKGLNEDDQPAASPSQIGQQASSPSDSPASAKSAESGTANGGN